MYFCTMRLSGNCGKAAMIVAVAIRLHSTRSQEIRPSGLR